MNRITLLEQLKEDTDKAVKDLIMPVRVQSVSEEQQYRAADVYLMRLSDSSAAKKKAPYIIHQVITGKDSQQRGSRADSICTVRSIFCVYNDDEQEGGLMLLNLMERLRIYLLQRVVIGGKYQLNLEAGLETLIYPNESAPYYVGEMVSTWDMPSVEREVMKCL